jgi:hypothetical protein
MVFSKTVGAPLSWQPGTMARRARQSVVGPVLLAGPTRNGVPLADFSRKLDRIAERRVQIRSRLTRERAQTLKGFTIVA